MIIIITATYWPAKFSNQCLLKMNLWNFSFISEASETFESINYGRDPPVLMKFLVIAAGFPTCMKIFDGLMGSVVNIRNVSKLYNLHACLSE